MGDEYSKIKFYNEDEHTIEELRKHIENLVV